MTTNDPEEKVPSENVTDVVSPDHAQHLRLLEALIFAGTQALDEKELAERLPNDADVARLLGDLGGLFANRGGNLGKGGGGDAFWTPPVLWGKIRTHGRGTPEVSRAPSTTPALLSSTQAHP